MSSICFRCDRQGRAPGRTCPSCGAPLHRIEPQPPGRRVEAEGDVEHEPGLDSASVQGAGRSRSAGWIGPVVMVAVIALVAAAAIEAVTTDRSRTRAPADAEGLEGGRLVYLARSEGADVSLWILDLAAGRAGAGPVVPASTVELVDASGVGPDWVGVERRTSDGVRVAVLRGMLRATGVAELGRGDLVAWGPGGTSLVIARNGSASGPCPPVRMSLIFVPTREVQWSLHDPGFCGPVTSLSRSAAATYFTAPSGDRYGVYLTGQVGGPHLLFEGFSLVSGSPVSAFLLRRADDPDVLPYPEPEALLGWNGIGGPLSLGHDDAPLVVRRVLAWSRDGAHVALLGTLGPTSGVFVVDAGSGTGQRRPVFVELEAEAEDATFDARGSLYMSAGGRLFVYRAGSVRRVRLPDGAPPPAGPVVWIP